MSKAIYPQIRSCNHSNIEEGRNLFPFFFISLSFDMVGHYFHMYVVNNNKSSSTGDMNSLVS